uniref:NADH-ubiquinone oxidoreductase chain 5 n=1 Tax=Prionospio fallax TaxID=3050094 RepID=A0AAU6QGF8_9ANNE
MFPRSYPLIAATFLFLMTSVMLPLSLYLMINNMSIIFDWIITPLYSPIEMTLILDPFGTLFSFIVTLISANVMLFAHSYMNGDPFLPRFIQLVLLFVASMNFLIFIPNLMTLLLGWDGLGLVSFLLVIYYQNANSLGAGMITALTNRIGDALILISIAWAVNLGFWNMMFTLDFSFSLWFSISLAVAAMTKSAQIPFSSWLPAAMAAPTPVSALVHSSTLVTAGVFLLFRFYPFLSLQPSFNSFLLIMATLTSLMAGLSAITECDMKKIIALSTLSQLGVMMVSLGLGAPLLAFFHLITHALFKALLFLCAGTLIHLHHHSQDLRYMGNLVSQLPSISSAMMVSNLALCGTPFLAGFYSKDAILEFSLFNPTNILVLILFFFATSLTVAYTTRFLLAVLWSPSNVSAFHPLNDNDIFCSLPTFILASASIMGGASLNWLLITPSVEFFLPTPLKMLTLMVCLLGFFFGYTLNSSFSTSNAFFLLNVKKNFASCKMWFLTPISTQKFLISPFWFAHQLQKNLDHGWEEVFGGQGALMLMTATSPKTLSPQNNMLTTHLSLSLLVTPLMILSYML